MAFKITPLENMNEFTTHILEIVNAHMILRKNLMVCSHLIRILIPSCPLLRYWLSPKERDFLVHWGNYLPVVGQESLKLLEGYSEGITGVLAPLGRDCVAGHFQRFLLGTCF